MDSLDENTSNDGIPARKKKRPSRASKTEKVLQVLQDMRQESIKRHSEEKSDRSVIFPISIKCYNLQFI